MRCYIRLLLLSLIAVVFVNALPAEQRVYAEHNAKIASQGIATSSGLLPLPNVCIGGLPPNSGASACCIFGYVIIDGQPVAGAKVTIAGPKGTIELWTADGPNSTRPYYRASLSDAPLQAHVGDTISISAEYSSHHTRLEHSVLGGGQHLDLVLHRAAGPDYVFQSKLWGQGAPGELNRPSAVAVDGAGTVYVADRHNARVQVFNSNGEPLRQWGTQGDAYGQFADPIAIAVDTQGDVYVADSTLGRIQKFTSTGAWIATIGRFGDGKEDLKTPRDMAIGPNGDVYVIDMTRGRVQRYTKDGAWVNGWGDAAQFSNPQGIAVDREGNVYVADTEHHQIKKFTPTGALLATWGGPGQFNRPYAIAVNDTGTIYVVDKENARIVLLDSAGKRIASWGAGAGSAENQFNRPEGIVLDRDGNIYVADSANDRIQKLRADGTFVSRWGRKGMAAGQFDRPHDVAIDTQGSLYVADTDNNRVQKRSASGSWIRSLAGPDAANGKRFRRPTGVATDSENALYVVDQGAHEVYKFGGSGAYIRTLGGYGTGQTQLNAPTSVAIDQQNNSYIVDSGNKRIQKFDIGGIWRASWDSWQAGGTTKRFEAPSGIAVGPDNTVYVVDSGARRVERFTADGVWLNGWGSPGIGNGLFEKPLRVTVDRGGTVYVSDERSERIQLFTSEGTFIGRIGTYGAGDGELAWPTGMAVDQQGQIVVADRYNNRVQFFRAFTTTRPHATIVTTDPRTITQGQPFELIGAGRDSDATLEITGYEWRLDDAAAPFATDARTQLQTDTLAPGRHTISLRVRDNEGEVSDPQTVALEVLAKAQRPIETWTLLLYLDADTHGADLESYLGFGSPQGALERLIRDQANPYASVMVLYDGPGDHNSTRYHIIGQQIVHAEPLGEVNMGDPQTLIDFVRWGQQTAPAHHYYLAMVDHANALDGIAWDSTSGPNERLTPLELRQAFLAMTDNGARPFDVVHFDVCLMGMLEIAYQLRGMTKTMVASENLAWSAFAYELYRASIGERTSPQEFAVTITDRYVQRVGEKREAADSTPYTIAAIDMAKLDATMRAAEQFARESQRFALASAANRAMLAQLRTQAQTLDANADYALTPDDAYVDIDRWAQLVATGVGDPAMRAAAEQLRTTLSQMVLKEHHMSGQHNCKQIALDNARGIGIYYPTSAGMQLNQQYLNGGLVFPDDSRWDEYLVAAVPASKTPQPPGDTTRPAAPLQ